MNILIKTVYYMIYIIVIYIIICNMSFIKNNKENEILYYIIYILIK